MSRTKFIMLMVLATLMFSGCARSNKDNSSSQNSQTSAEAQVSSALDEFFLEVSADQPKDEVLAAAKKKGLQVATKNTNTGVTIYTITEKSKEEDYIKLSYNALRNNSLQVMIYFDADKAIEGHWTPEKGYSVADHNYPQLFYIDSETSKATNYFPVSSAEEVINFQLTNVTEPNKLEELFKMVTPEMTTEAFIQKAKELGLQYNSRGVGNEDIISYHYKVGAKYGENGSYLTFDTGKDDVVEKVEYLFFSTQKKLYIVYTKRQIMIQGRQDTR